LFLIKSIVKYYKLIFYNTFMLYWNSQEQNSDKQTTSSWHFWPQNWVKKSFNNILQFTSKKDQIIHRLSQIWINVSREDIDLDTTSLSDEAIKEKYSPDEPNIHIAPMLSTKALFDMIWLDKNSLKDKNITDIWWWFTSLPFELQDIVNSLEIIDPCFSWDIERLIEADIVTLEKNLQTNKTYIEEKEKYILKLNKELDNYIDDFTTRGQSIYRDLDREINEIKKNIEKSRKSLSIKLQVIDELKMWKELIKKRKSQSNNFGFQNINFNSSVWENIKWINDDTQDLVFINHLLSKPNVNPYLILSEASRIVKSGWEIIVVNDKSTSLDSLENSGIKINHENNRHKIWFRLIKN